MIHDPSAVEALARDLHEAHCASWPNNGDNQWGSLPEKAREYNRDKARWLLERYDLITKNPVPDFQL